MYNKGTNIIMSELKRQLRLSNSVDKKINPKKRIEQNYGSLFEI